MLNKAICLRCCEKQQIEKGLDGFDEYTESFNRYWDISGKFLCEEQNKWIKVNSTDKANEALISKCPYLLEHTINA